VHVFLNPDSDRDLQFSRIHTCDSEHECNRVLFISINPHHPDGPRGTMYLYNCVHDNKEERDKNEKKHRMRPTPKQY
jgi:hypothetical protein